jgi:hypothetical protein
MAGQYTYLLGLLVFGVILGAAGIVAAERERRARIGHGDAKPEQLPLPMSSSQPPAHAR